MQASIFVTDDKPALRNAFVKRLSWRQHRVSAFQPGDELLTEVEQDLPDLILLDLKMPGIEVLAALRTKARDALVIILTLYGTVKDWVEAMKLGAYGLLIKTVALEGVGDIVPLSKRFMVKYGMELGKEVVEIDPAAIANLERYPFPGNVRERQNVIERAMILCKGKILTAGDLPCELREVTAPVTVA